MFTWNIRHMEIKITPEKIERDIVVILSGEDEEREYSYIESQSGRTFRIRRSGYESDFRFFLFEFEPNGRIGTFDKKGNCTGSEHVPQLSEAWNTSPNSFSDFVKRTGIDHESIIRTGGGYGIDSLYSGSLFECAERISESLSSDSPCSCRRTLGEDEKTSMKRREEKMSLDYWRVQKKQAESAMSDKGLFKGCHSMMSVELDGDIKKSILSYINSPDQDAWNDIRGYLVVGNTTLWQAWCLYSPDAPKSGSVGFPDSKTVKNAIRNAVDANMTEIESRLLKAESVFESRKPQKIVDNSDSSDTGQTIKKTSSPTKLRVVR